MLREACTKAARWPDHVKVAVNLSCAQLKSGDFIVTARAALRDSGLAANRLELEVTESVLLENSGANVAILNELHAMGIRITMDDFGTGYSSLCYLREFPFDRIKIDRSFVRDLSDDISASAIVHAVLTLAKQLGLATTAEGIETSAQLEELRRLGCTEAQGYFFGKPAPATEARGLFALDAVPENQSGIASSNRVGHAA